MPYPFYQQTYQPQYQQYFPANYQPIQPQQQIQQQPYNVPPVSSGIIWIDSEKDAAMYPIAPNNAVALWEKSGKRAYMKKADATGKPTMTVYDLVERAETAYDGSLDADGKTQSYATKEELGAVVSVVKGFDELLGSIKADIDTMKSDMYGIAGKKKSARKTQEVAEDDE